MSGADALEGGFFLAFTRSISFRRRSANPETRCLKGHTAKGGPQKGHTVNSATPLLKIIPYFSPFTNTIKAGQCRSKPKASFKKNRFISKCFKSTAMFLGQGSGKNYTWRPGKNITIIFSNCKQWKIKWHYTNTSNKMFPQARYSYLLHICHIASKFDLGQSVTFVRPLKQILTRIHWT